MRLFVTVGAQMPFDRLIEAVDAWAHAHPEDTVLAQIGRAGAAPRYVEYARTLAPAAFDRAIREADALVGHAGIGTLFAALENAKPIVVLPREADRRETRNDHQIATARRFEASHPSVIVAWSAAELGPAIESLRSIRAEETIAPEASGPLIDAIARFLDS